MKKLLFFITMILCLLCAKAQTEKLLPLTGGTIQPVNVNYPVTVIFPSNSYTAVNFLGGSIKTTDFKSVTIKLAKPVFNPLILIINDLETDKIEKNIEGSDEVTIDFSMYPNLKIINNIRLLSASPSTDVSYTVNDAFLVRKDGSKEWLVMSNMNAKLLDIKSASFIVPRRGFSTLFCYDTLDLVNLIKEYKKMEIEFLEPLNGQNFVVEFNTKIGDEVKVIYSLPINSGQSKVIVNLPSEKTYSYVQLFHLDEGSDGIQKITINNVKLVK